MLATEFESSPKTEGAVPFCLHLDLARNPTHRNWHEDLEIQACTRGSGTVLLDGKAHSFSAGDVIVINPETVHYTFTDGSFRYDCLILRREFGQRMGVGGGEQRFSARPDDPELFDLMGQIRSVYRGRSDPLRVARLNELILRLLIRLAEKHTVSVFPGGERTPECVRGAVRYLREHYAEKITLDDVAGALYTDKYALCRVFRKYTGQTVVEALNRYRCRRAEELLEEGATVAEAAQACGFEHPAYFTKLFKRYVGTLPSDLRGGPGDRTGKSPEIP